MKIEVSIDEKENCPVVNFKFSSEDIAKIRDDCIARLRNNPNMEAQVILLGVPKCETIAEGISLLQGLSDEEFLRSIAVTFLFASDGSNLDKWGLQKINPTITIFTVDKA